MAEACPTATGRFSRHPLGSRPDRRPKLARLKRGTAPAAGNRSPRPRLATDFSCRFPSTPGAGYPPNRASVSATALLHRAPGLAPSGPAPFDEDMTIVQRGFVLTVSSTIYGWLSAPPQPAHPKPHGASFPSIVPL